MVCYGHGDDQARRERRLQQQLPALDVKSPSGNGMRHHLISSMAEDSDDADRLPPRLPFLATSRRRGNDAGAAASSTTSSVSGATEQDNPAMELYGAAAMEQLINE
nr:hypothetical protein Itr_chr09CG16240 [Ipomoea trifida]